MSDNLDRFKGDLAKLIGLGSEMLLDLDYRHRGETKSLKKEEEADAKRIYRSLEQNYQRWYTEACAVIKQLLPDRLHEFKQLCHGDGKRKKIDVATYNIQDWLNGVRAGTDNFGKKAYDDFAAVFMRFNTQLSILTATESRLKSSLFNIAQLTRADLFDSELDAARELVRAGFLRPAGMLAGVVLEKHLAQVCDTHEIPLCGQGRTISMLNDALKTAEVLDVPRWRQIQRLGDVRNLCGHSKDREPTKEEVTELIDGTERFIKTLF
jgi:hypothetical protein